MIKTDKKQQLITLDITYLKEAATKSGSTGRRARHKLEILSRDGFKCTKCGTQNNLTIAHIVPPQRKKSRNSTSYKIDDCKTLCEQCHLFYDKK